MKRKLCIILAVVICFMSFAACGKESGTSGIPDIEEATDTKEIVEIIPSDKPAAEGEFGSSAEFSGIYEITGFSTELTGKHFTISLKGLDNNNRVTQYDASETNLPAYIVDGFKQVYLKLTYGDNGLEDWSLIDRVSQVNLGQLSEEDLMDHIYPERKYEEVSAGNISSQDEILLSEYPAGKTYVFDSEMMRSGNFAFPKIINDTDDQVLIVSVKVGKDNDFERRPVTIKMVGEQRVLFKNTDCDENDKFYMAVIKVSAEQLVAAGECASIGNTDVGSEIDFKFEDFVYNDTGKTAVLDCEGKTYTLENGEIIECSWLNRPLLKELF